MLPEVKKIQHVIYFVEDENTDFSAPENWALPKLPELAKALKEQGLPPQGEATVMCIIKNLGYSGAVFCDGNTATLAGKVMWIPGEPSKHTASNLWDRKLESLLYGD